MSCRSSSAFICIYLRLPLLVVFIGVAALAALAAAQAAAQPYPSRPVRIIIPQAAGGAVDGAWWPIAQKLTEAWGQQVIVDNRNLQWI